LRVRAFTQDDGHILLREARSNGDGALHRLASSTMPISAWNADHIALASGRRCAPAPTSFWTSRAQMLSAARRPVWNR